MSSHPSSPNLAPPEQPELLLVSERFPRLYRELLVVISLQLRQLGGPDAPMPGLLTAAHVLRMQDDARQQLSRQASLGGKPDFVFKACFGAACREVLRARRVRRLLHPKLDPELALQFEGLPVTDFSALRGLLLQLAAMDSLQALLVEARGFGLLTVDECADLFQVSPETVVRRWQLGTGWLRMRLTAGRDDVSHERAHIEFRSTSVDPFGKE